MTVAVSETARRHTWTFVVERYRLAYVTVPKAACTTMKWLFADLAGERLTGAGGAMHGAASRRQLVHQPSLWQHTPDLDAFTPQERAAMTREAGWFAFTVVRDPRVRLWSAWQSKLLLRMSAYVTKYRGESWFPRVPTQPDHVVDDFAAFVRAYEKGTLGRIADDRHFRPQSEVLAAYDVPDLRVYDLGQLPRLTDDIQAHLRPYERTVPELTRENPTPLPLIDAVLDNGVQEAIERVFAADFERFGGLWPARPRTKPAEAWMPGAFDDIAVRVDMHERLGDLAGMARRRARRV